MENMLYALPVAAGIYNPLLIKNGTATSKTSELNDQGNHLHERVVPLLKN